MNNYEERIIAACEPGTKIGSIRYTKSTNKIELVCKNGHTRLATPNGILSKGSNVFCEICKRESQANAKGVTIVSEFTHSFSPLTVRKISCGHTFTVSQATSVLRAGKPVYCPECDGVKVRTHEQIIEEIKGYGITLLEPIKNVKTNIRFKFDACGHESINKIDNLLRNKSPSTCPICIDSVRNRFFNFIKTSEYDLIDEYKTTQTPVQIKHQICGMTHYATPNNLVSSGTGIRCPECSPSTQSSMAEESLKEFIVSKYSGWIEIKDRSILGGKELDIVLPDLGVAIEYNGAYWHSEELRGKDYHLDKTKKVEEFGYKLLHIMDSEWLTKKEIVKSRISNILGTSTRIFARGCVIKEIPFPSTFLFENHIQGVGSITSINYGLYYKEELVAVMTFSKPRFNSSYDYELVRYCSKINTTVVGGASKLLKYFMKQFPSASIISYSDKRWSQGGLYKTIGFKFSHTSAPSYKYYKGNKVLSRYQCQKHLLKDMFPDIYRDELTESEIVGLAGYNKVFDCGNDVWVV